MGSNRKLSADQLEKIIIYIFAPLCVCGVVYITYALKGIYPFGSLTIDYYDMGQEVLAFYYHIYDFMHGTKSVNFDWYTALGMNMSAGTSGCSNISPFNIFFWFISRNMIRKSMSLFLALKLMCMAASFAYCLRTVSKSTDTYIKFTLSVGYGLCGYVMMHYTIMPWLDIAAVFPLIIATVYMLLREGKMTGYVVVLTISVIMSYYLSIMILIYIFVGTGLYMFINRYIYKQKNYTNVARLGIGTVVSLMLSGVVVVPHLLQTLGSTRYGNNLSIIDILTTTKSPYESRWWALLGTALCFAIIVVGIYRDIRRNGKKSLPGIIWTVGMVFVSCAELLFENVNLIMHFGSYVHYPIRNGFIIYATVALLAAYYIGKEQDVHNVLIKNKVSHVIELIVTMASVVVGIIAIMWYKSLDTIGLGGVVSFTFKIAGVFFALYIVLLLFGSVQSKKYTVPVVFLCQIIVYAYLFVGPVTYDSFYSQEPEQTGDYIDITNMAVESFGIEPSYMDRIKNPDESLNTNYGFVMRRPTLSNMTHLVSDAVQQGAANLGYSIQFTRLLDAGGTAFTDALLHITNTISCNEQNNILYSEIGRADLEVSESKPSADTYYYYDNNYVLPFGITVPASAIDILAESNDVIGFNNAMFDAAVRGLQTYDLSKEDKKLADELGSRELATLLGLAMQGDAQYELEGSKLLYFWGACADQEYMNTTITVNGMAIKIPTITNTDNVKYPAHFNNNAVFLGAYADEEVNVNINTDNSNDEPAYLAGLFTIDYEMLTQLCELEKKYNTNTCVINGNAFECMAEGKSDAYLILPIAYDEGFSVTCNGAKVDGVCINGLFTAVPLADGMSDIRMTYMPGGLKAGIVLTALGMIACVIICVILDKKVIKKSLVFAEQYIGPVYLCVWTVVVMAIYIIPSILCIILRI